MHDAVHSHVKSTDILNFLQDIRGGEAPAPEVSLFVVNAFARVCHELASNKLRIRKPGDAAWLRFCTICSKPRGQVFAAQLFQVPQNTEDMRVGFRIFAHQHVHFGATTGNVNLQELGPGPRIMLVCARNACRGLRYLERKLGRQFAGGRLGDAPNRHVKFRLSRDPSLGVLLCSTPPLAYGSYTTRATTV